MLFRNWPKQIEQKNMSNQSIFGCNNLLVHFKLDFCYMLSLLSGFKAFLLELENMQFQRVKNPCPCCNVQQCRLSTSANQDLNRKEILQPLIWPTEQPPQIFQFDLDFHQRHYQQAFSFQFQLQIAEGYDGEQRGHPEKPSKSMETREKQKQTIHDNDSNDYFKPFDGLHGNGLLDRIQSILNDQFINIQLMQEESPEDRLVDKEWTQSNNSSAPKNANMPKFLIRLFLQYFAQFGEMGLQAMDQSVRKFINDYQRRYKMNPKSFYKLDQLIDLLRLQEWIKERNIVLRRILNAIIRAKGRSQIIKSTQLKRKISYLNATKVYSLRCLNYSLAQRLQSK